MRTNKFELYDKVIVFGKFNGIITDVSSKNVYNVNCGIYEFKNVPESYLKKDEQ